MANFMEVEVILIAELSCAHVPNCGDISNYYWDSGPEPLLGSLPDMQTATDNTDNSE